MLFGGRGRPSEEGMGTSSDRPDRIQLHLVVPYKTEIRQDPKIRTYLGQGYRIVQLQRLTDREVITTLEK
jgi:hypothetical protein